jgi:hypothetical protein
VNLPFETTIFSSWLSSILGQVQYRDYSTTLDFTMKGVPPKSEENEQEVLFVVANTVEAPQKEVLFSPDELA